MLLNDKPSRDDSRLNDRFKPNPSRSVRLLDARRYTVVKLIGSEVSSLKCYGNGMGTVYYMGVGRIKRSGNLLLKVTLARNGRIKLIFYFYPWTRSKQQFDGNGN